MSCAAALIHATVVAVVAVVAVDGVVCVDIVVLPRPLLYVLRPSVSDHSPPASVLHTCMVLSFKA